MRYGFVVEGLHDKDLLLRTYDNIGVVSCRGTVLNRRIKTDIQKLLNTCDRVYLLLDPDEAGFAFTERVQQVFNLPSLVLDPRQCMCYRFNKLKIGVEHASTDYLTAFFIQNGIFLQNR